MLERVLALAGQPAARGRHHQVLVLQRLERRAELRAVVPGLGDRALPERLPDHRRGLQHAGARRAVSASSRAASTECTVSGSASVSAAPSSTIRLTISSANSGLPPERAATSVARSPVSPPASPNSAATSSCAWARSSGSRVIVVALTRPPPQSRPAVEQLVAGQADDQHRPARPSAPGTRSGRACPRRPSGCPRPRRAAGWRRLPASTTSRTAENSRSRICCGSSSRALDRLARAARSRAAGRARRRPGRRAPRSRSRSSSSSIPRFSLRQAARGVVGVDDVEGAADDLAERPVGEPGAVRRGSCRAAIGGRCGPVADLERSARAAGATCRPRPGPITVTRCGRFSAITRSNRASSRSVSSSRPTSGVVARAARGRGRGPPLGPPPRRIPARPCP